MSVWFTDILRQWAVRTDQGGDQTFNSFSQQNNKLLSVLGLKKTKTDLLGWPTFCFFDPFL